MSNKKQRLNLTLSPEEIGYLHFLLDVDEISSMSDCIGDLIRKYVETYAQTNDLDMGYINTKAARAYERSRKPKGIDQRESHKHTVNTMFKDMKKSQPQQPTSYDNWMAATSDEPTMDDWLKYGNRPKAKAPLEEMKQRYPERYKNVTEEEYMRDDFTIGGTNRNGEK